jgi:O-antigen/teichoic acid export membrane protein
MTARLSRHTLLLLVSNVGGAALSFALSVLIGRALGGVGLGAYTVVLAWVFPLSLLVEFGLSTLATREIAKDEQTAADYLDAMTRARLLLGGIATAALIVLAPFLSADSLVITGLIISAPMIIILPFFSAFTAVFKARGAMWPIPYLNIGMLAAQVILTALAFLTGGGVIAAMIVNVVTSAGQLLAAWAIWRWKFAPSAPAKLRSAPTLTRLLRQAWPFALAALFAALQTRISVILLDNIASTADVGYYAAASRFVEAGRMIPNAFFGALFPALAALALKPDLLRSTFNRAMIGLTVFGVLAGLAALLLAPSLITFAYGDSFAPAAPVLQVLMWSLLFSLLRGGRTLYWYALGREQQVNVVNGAVIVLQLALSLWLIPRLGAVGAAWALLAVEVAGLALLWREIHLPMLGRLRYEER